MGEPVKPSLVALTTWAGACRSKPSATASRHRVTAFLDASGRAIASTTSNKRHARIRPRTQAPTRSSARRSSTARRARRLNATIVVRDGRIAAIGPQRRRRCRAACRRRRRRARSIVPGLWDMHAHASQSGLGARVSGERRDDDSRHGRGRARSSSRFVTRSPRARRSGRGICSPAWSTAVRAHARSAWSRGRRRKKARESSAAITTSIPGDEDLLRVAGRRRAGHHAEAHRLGMTVTGTCRRPG